MCSTIGLSCRTLQRWKTETKDRRNGPILHARKLSESEQALVLATACDLRFSDLAPARIVAKLADENRYVASESTFYRLLRGEKLLAHRSRAKRPERKPQVVTVAERPNQVWAWDITNLRSKIPGGFFKLYLFEDLFSRKIVAAKVFEHETEMASAETFESAIHSESISGKNLRLHADNGRVMRGSMILGTLLKKEVIPSFSRPSVSNDNAYVESAFKTLKYSPQYPTKPFQSRQEASVWVEKYVLWYNTEHQHSGLSYVTPEQRHSGKAEALLEGRRTVYLTAKAENPHRWSGLVKSWKLPKLAQLNPHGQRFVK
jgi:transposase InsO family protein